MIRSAASKLTWMARATTTVAGLAIMLALVVGLASTALAHTGVDKKLFHLGHNNPVTAASTLAGNLAGKVLQVSNAGTGNGSAAIQANNKSPRSPAVRAINSGGGPAVGLGVGAGKPPLTVNASAGKATNLNADKLDGQEASSFANATHAHAGEEITSGTVEADRIEDGAGSNLNADQLDGRDSSLFVQGKGKTTHGAAALSPGGSWTMVLIHWNTSPDISVYYSCPSSLTNNGTLRIKNWGAETINVFSDNGGSNPNDYRQLSQYQTFDQGAAATGERVTLQVQGSGVGTIDVFSVHRATDCHVQAQGLFTYP